MWPETRSEARTSRKSGPGLIDEIFCKNLIIDFCRNCLPHPLHVVSICCMVCTWSMNNGNNLTSLEFRVTCFLRLVKSCRTEQVGNTSAIPTYKHHCHRCHRPSNVFCWSHLWKAWHPSPGSRSQEAACAWSAKQMHPQSPGCTNLYLPREQEFKFQNRFDNQWFLCFILPTLALGSFNLWKKIV